MAHIDAGAPGRRKRQLGNDKIIPLGAASEIPAHRLGRVSAKHRMDAILEKKNSPAIVRALPAEDLYFLIKDIGLDDAGPLVAMAGPAQFRSFIDLDCWHSNEGNAELSVKDLLCWFHSLRESSSAENVAINRATLDLEVIEIVLRESLRIVDKEAVEEYGWSKGAPGEDPEAAWVESPCGSWLISYLLDDQEGIELRRLVDELYAEDPYGASRFLSAIRAELTSELTEYALRFRHGRLEDMGFPPPEVAASLYAKVDISSPPPLQPKPNDGIPGFFLSEFNSKSFLDLCAKSVIGTQNRTRLDRSLIYLANTVLVADSIEPADTEAVKDAISRMRAYLNLGLYHLAAGNSDRGVDLLQSAALRHIFQIGFTLTLQRKWRATTIQDRVRQFTNSLEPFLVFDTPERQVLKALMGRRPLFALALDASVLAGWPSAPEAFDVDEAEPDVRLQTGTRPFAVPEDLTLADQALDRAEGMLAVSKNANLFDIPDPEADPHSPTPNISVLALTAMLNLSIGNGFIPRALKTDSLREAISKSRDEAGNLKSDVLESALSLLIAANPEERSEHSSSITSIASTRFAKAFSRRDLEPDPRFIDSVRIART